MNKEDLQKEAYDVYHELTSMLKAEKTVFLYKGKLLSEVKEKKLYKYMGEGGYDSFNQFLNNAEIGVAPSTAIAVIDIYRYYVERLGMQEEIVANMPISRLRDLMTTLKKKSDDEAQSLISDLGVLTNYDYHAEAERLNLKVSKPKLVKCKTCNKWQVIPNGSEFCDCTPDETISQ